MKIEKPPHVPAAHPSQIVYRCEDRSILAPYLKKHVLEPILRRIPEEASANTITLLSTVGNLIAFLWLISAHDPPGAAMVIPILGIGWYMILDNLDGAQARRAGISSPLGEFMDHWVDGLNMMLVNVGFVIFFGVRPELALAVCVTGALVYTATMWEQYRTGWIRMGGIGNIEGILILLTFYAATGILGPDAMRRPVLWGLTMGEVFALANALSFVAVTVEIGGRVRGHGWDVVPIAGLTVMVALLGWAGLASLNPIFAILVFLGALAPGRFVLARLMCRPYRPVPSVLGPGAVVLVIAAVTPGIERETHDLLCAAYLACCVFTFLGRWYRGSSFLMRELGIDLRGFPRHQPNDLP